MNWKLYTIIIMLQILSAFAMFSYIPMLVPIAEELNLNSKQIGMVALANSIGGMIFGVYAGLLVDRLHTRFMILLGPGVITLSLFVFSISSTFPLILLANFLLGIGYTIILPLTSRLIAFYFSSKQMGMLLSLKQSGSTIGQAMGGFLLPIIILTFSWRFSLHLLTVMMIAVLLFYFLFFFSKDTHRAKSKSEKMLKEKKKRTFDNIKIPRDTIFLLVLGFSMLGYQATFATFLIPYLSEQKEVNYAFAGAMLGGSQLVGAFSRPLLGWLSDTVFKGSRKKVLLICGLGNIFLTLILIYLPSSYIILTVVVLFLLGITAFGWAGVYFAYIVEIIGKEKSGLATGYGLMANSMGAAVNPLFFGAIVDYTSYEVAFVANTIFLLIMVGLLQVKLKEPAILLRKERISSL